MKYGIVPTVDCVFKAILGAEENKNLLIHFLNAVLEPSEPHRIRDVDILNPYNEKELLSDKTSIVDVKARDQSDTTYQIEVQVAVYAGLVDRILYGWCDLYAAQLTKGDEYDQLKPVVSIWLLANPLFEQDEEFHHRFRVTDSKTGTILGEKSGIHVLELKKWNKAVAENEVDRWLLFFKDGPSLDDQALPTNMDTHEMRQAMETLKRFTEKEREYHLYQNRMNFIREQNTIRKELKRLAQEREAALQAVQEKEAAFQSALQEKETAFQAALQEKERFRQRLIDAGIDPDD